MDSIWPVREIDPHLFRGLIEPRLTNYQRIKVMTEEQLAEFLRDTADLGRMFGKNWECNTKEQWIEWLRREGEPLV